MSKSKMLLADFSTGEFARIPDFPHPTQMSVMPVVAYRDNQIKMLGTCFAISNHGLVITARHVLDVAVRITGWSTGQPRKHDKEWWVGALYVSKPIPGEDEHNLLGGIIPANKIHMSGSLDIGVMHLNLPMRKDDQTLLTMPALRLSPALPNIGDRCIATGYHSMKSEPATDSVHRYAVEQSYSASRGVVEELHFPYRDKAYLNFPCFRTSSRFDPGMSGAPILGENGDVMGVVCSSFGDLDGQGYISYGSLIGPALLLQFDAADVEGTIKPCFLHDFVTGGSVATNETIDQLRISRQENTLEIYFGIPPTIMNELGS